MTARAVVLLRHGRTAYNATARLQGQVDIPLDDVGLWQAAQAAEHLAPRHAPARIVSSDLVRARVTAQALSDLVGVPVETDERLRERCFGDWEGLTADEIAERWPQAYGIWRSGLDPERPGAESRAAVGERMATAVGQLAQELDAEQTLVVVSHGAAITLGIARLLGLDPTTWRGMGGLHNAHWSLLRHSGRPNSTPWYVESHNLGPAVVVDDWNAGVPGEVLPSSTADALRS
ncbi:MAG: histidine phosphatase family protein [Cellulomonadaceae bacterium]|nr:histidine phosphatase family protein [Cellulomonadaceae bacterium]